jgi:multiple sugar transport system ATP-binding protein
MAIDEPSELAQSDDERGVSASQSDSADDIGSEQASVVLKNLHKEFGDIVAVDDVSLRVEQGGLLVLLGPSGCGKSTTLRMIAGLETPTSGTVMVGEEDVTRTLPQKRDLSMVFQNYALYPHKTVRGNLAFPLGKSDLSENEKDQKIQQTAELLEIDDLLEKEPGQLSGGQRQRVALGRTIIREPRAFLMDEPLSNLDARLRVKTRSELRQLQKQLGTTTIYVTHDQEEAMSLADRIAVMYDGELLQSGTPKEVYQNPTNRFVASFIGEPSMNFFERVSDAENDGECTIFPEDPVTLDINVPEQTHEIGVRPENVYPTGFSTRAAVPSSTVSCRVGIVEPLGNAYEIEFERGGVSFTARLRDRPDDTIKPGETIEVLFDCDATHAFTEGGDAIQ